MPQRHAVIPSTHLKPGQMECFDVADQRIILANVAGEFYAFDEMCSHEEFPLWYGALKGHHVECSLHGSCFDIRTGHPDAEPASAPIRTYRTEVADGTVYVVID